MSRPSNPTCGDEVLYWYKAVTENPAEEGVEKAEKKLRCYVHHCREQMHADVQFKWCCKSAAPCETASTSESLQIAETLLRASGRLQ